MDPASEALMRSALHDLANVLSGVRGILELSDPNLPLTPRDQSRLEAVIADGMVALERSRHLAMGTLPESMVESGTDWRHQLGEQLKPLSVLFRRQFAIRHEGEIADDRWPGELLRGYALALTRQLLPYVQAGTLEIIAHASPKEWRLRWPQATVVPDSLKPDQNSRPRDIGARWAIRVGESLAATLHADAEGFTLRVPRF
ncbi:MAG: hypothetical protein IPN59_06700 [Holophaga sp.]|nr:hypothetical protein [Holophaga sp.]